MSAHRSNGPRQTSGGMAIYSMQSKKRTEVMSVDTIIGIDPGRTSGGIAIWFHDNDWLLKKMPTTEKDLAEFARYVLTDRFHPIAFVEKIGSFGRNYGTAIIKLALHYGVILGILSTMRIETHEVTPNVWQKKLNCLTKGDKSISKRRAQMLFPKLKITNATADALLIAEYGRQKLKIQ